MPRRSIEIVLPLVVVAWLMQPAPAPAEVTLHGEVRFFSSRDEPTWVGQETELYLELWSDGYSFGDQWFVLPEVPGGFLLQADSSTVKLAESREGVTWQGLRYTLLLYPQVAGRLGVPSFDVSFTARAGFGSDPKAFRFATHPLVIEAALPPGARANDLLVTTSVFSMSATWSRELPETGPLEMYTGDALTLEVQRRAEEVPGMVFAPLPQLRITGLGIYPAAPLVEDSVNRGALTGSRTDKVTFVCETPGSYEIPEWRFRWWDPEQEVLAERVIPAVRLEVAANPAYAGSGTPVSIGSEAAWHQAAIALAVGLMILGVAWFAMRPLAGWLRRHLHQRRAARRTRPARSGVLQPLNPRGPGSPRSG